jgi:D-aminopeptidase
MITNTNSVGVVRDAVIAYAAKRWGPKAIRAVVAAGGYRDLGRTHLNDIYGISSRPSIFRAIDSAPRARWPRATWAAARMVCYEFKGGIGTARALAIRRGRHGGVWSRPTSACAT